MVPRAWVDSFIIVNVMISSPLAQAASSARVVLKGLVCAYCAQGFERALIRHSEVRSVDVRLGSHDAIIQFRDGANLTDEQLRQVASEAGLGVSLVSSVASTHEVQVRE